MDRLGPMGLICSSFFYVLSDESLAALCDLYDKADEGLLPSLWSEARLIMIPKPGCPQERRPLTIMNIAYRIWSKRWAQHYNAWLHDWVPSGLVGARIGESAADTAQRVAATVNDAVTGHGNTKYLLSLDQSNFFDRMDLAMTKAICDRLGVC